MYGPAPFCEPMQLSPMPAVPVQGQHAQTSTHDTPSLFEKQDSVWYPAYPGLLSLLQITSPGTATLTLGQVSHIRYVTAHSLRRPQAPWATVCQVPVAVRLSVTKHVQLRLAEV